MNYEDLKERLEKAVEELDVLRNKAAALHNEHEYGRLCGKIEGVKLALDYLRTPD